MATFMMRAGATRATHSVSSPSSTETEQNSSVDLHELLQVRARDVGQGEPGAVAVADVEQLGREREAPVAQRR